jgi:hypothetical protein
MHGQECMLPKNLITLTNHYVIKNSMWCFIILCVLSKNSYQEKKIHRTTKSNLTMEMTCHWNLLYHFKTVAIPIPHITYSILLIELFWEINVATLPSSWDSPGWWARWTDSSLESLLGKVLTGMLTLILKVSPHLNPSQPHLVFKCMQIPWHKLRVWSKVKSLEYMDVKDTIVSSMPAIEDQELVQIDSIHQEGWCVWSMSIE